MPADYHHAVSIRPVVLLAPSRAAAMEIPRRLASTGRALTGLYPLTLKDLIAALAEPALLGRGLGPWDSGHDALLAQRLIDEEGTLAVAADLPRRPLARALARTLSELRAEGVDPAHLEAVARRAGGADGTTLGAVARLFRRFHNRVDGHFADRAALCRAAADEVGRAAWLRECEVVIASDLEPTGTEKAFLAALAAARPVRRIASTVPPGLRDRSFGAWAAGHRIAEVAAADTLLAPLAGGDAPAALTRLRGSLFEPPAGDPVRDGSVELMTAAGEAAEVRSIVRRLLREAARGVPFEDMGVLLARPHEYAPLFTDLLDRVGIPHRLHPSLPLHFGRSARALLLLFRCRGLARPAVMEFVTFAPIPFEALLGEEVTPRPAQWDALSRDAGIVSGLERWRIGLGAYAAEQRGQAGVHPDPERAERMLRKAGDADALRVVVEEIAATVETLAGAASWRICDRWIGPGRDREALLDVIADLGGLGFTGGVATWDEVEAVLEARLEWERLPLDPVAGGAVHVGALDAMAGLSFRVLAIPGLVEGGYPGVQRPDPFLLDSARAEVTREARAPLLPAKRPRAEVRQLALFETHEPNAAPPPAAFAGLATVDDRVARARRRFHRAVSQAGERLILSYPRADARTGRERLPSLFFVTAAAALAGRPLSGVELARAVEEDVLATLDVDDALDAGERDRIRVRRGGEEAVRAIKAGSPFFRHSREASRARWTRELTKYDGLVFPLPEAVARHLDPVTAPYPISASRLATFARCGFQYLLQHVLRLEAALEPEERMKLDALERGSAFHDTAENFLRERRDAGRFPVRDDEEERARLLELADEALDKLIASSPPRFSVLWEKERARFHEAMRLWLAREAKLAARSTPLHFEVSFGPARERAKGEPHDPEPLAVDLGDGRTLRVSGKIDRIDARPDGTLVLRDYKTGKAPPEPGFLFRGGQQLQMSFYLLAAERQFPGRTVADAFLDYVDGGRQVPLDPAALKGEKFRELLKGMVDNIAAGTFVQEHTSCRFCDYKAVCGPAPLLEVRRRFKINDTRLQRVLRLKSVG
jgi:ATP-dependent helicase/nuclease subunit B